MSKLAEVKSKVLTSFDKLKDTEAYAQLRAKYDELDQQSKFYVNIGALFGILFILTIPVLIGMAKVSNLNKESDANEELIGFLQRSSDTIKQLKAQQTLARGEFDSSTSLTTLVESARNGSGIAASKIEVGTEIKNNDDKETVESTLDVKLSQINLRQLTKFLFALTSSGATKQLNIRDLNIDTKGDPSGYLDVTAVVAGYNLKQ